MLYGPQIVPNLQIKRGRINASAPNSPKRVVKGFDNSKIGFNL